MNASAPRRVRAAGGVLTRERPGADGRTRTEVLLVHRPRYDDWTFPKGKADPGETDEQTARREVREETGLEADLGVELASVAYLDQRGRPKTVRYWHMTVRAGAFVANDEVDEIAWLPLDEAGVRLTYDHDREVLASLSPPPAAPDRGSR